ncbi:sugar ABC transporter permease [Candidatus Gracilibacteria bacterium]|nr:sugar ABC transporter permease [Candidatus Gracilibacteria bacterium]
MVFFNLLLNTVGLPSLPWLNSPRWALPAVIIVTIWQNLGFHTVIFLAGLRTVPQQFYDAASIDGANGWQRFWAVTFPLLSPTTFFVVVTAMIGAFQAFGQVAVLTGGGPANATRVLLFHIYTLAFRLFNIGEAAAVSALLFALLFALTVGQFWFARKWVYDG